MTPPDPAPTHSCLGMFQTHLHSVVGLCGTDLSHGFFGKLDCTTPHSFSELTLHQSYLEFIVVDTLTPYRRLSVTSLASNAQNTVTLMIFLCTRLQDSYALSSFLHHSHVYYVINMYIHESKQGKWRHSRQTANF